jgi:hypothetical protein
MSVHTHTLRDWCAYALLLVPAPLLLGWVWAPASRDFEVAQVSGQVTCANQPFSGAIYFLPVEEGGTDATGPVNRDGSFQVYAHGIRNQPGAVPGTYRVVVRPLVADQAGSRVDSKYQDSRTTDLLVHVGPGWNDIRFNLH